MSKVKGIVMSVSDRGIVVLGKDGSFYKVPKPEEVPLIGEEIEINLSANESRDGYEEKRNWFSTQKIRSLGLVAAILLIVIATVFFFPSSPQAAYVVALDINPSMELYLDHDDKVLKIIPYGQDAEQLLAKTNLKGKEFSLAILEITRKAEEKGLLPDGNAEIIATIIDWDEERDYGENLLRKLNKQLRQNNKSYHVQVHTESKDILEEAHKEKLPINKYLILKQAEQKGIPVQKDEIEGKSVRQLMDAYQVNPFKMKDQKKTEDNHSSKHEKKAKRNLKQNDEEKSGQKLHNNREKKSELKDKQFEQKDDRLKREKEKNEKIEFEKGDVEEKFDREKQERLNREEEKKKRSERETDKEDRSVREKEKTVKTEKTEKERRKLEEKRKDNSRKDRDRSGREHERSGKEHENKERKSETRQKNNDDKPHSKRESNGNESKDDGSR